jgi:hypothetical protein
MNRIEKSFLKTERQKQFFTLAENLANHFAKKLI